MKKNNQIKLLYQFTIILILLSCKDIQPFKHQISTSKDEGLKEMKLWFESEIKTKNLRLQKKGFNKKVFWDEAKIKKNGNDDYYLVPISYLDNILLSVKSNNINENYDYSLYSNTYLLLTNGSEKKALLITYIADKNYYFNNDFRVHGNNFTGKVIVNNWEDEFKYAYIYENGQIISTILPNDEKANKNKKNGRVVSCTYISIEFWVRGCYDGSNCTEYRYNHTISTSVFCVHTDSGYNPDAINWSQVIPSGSSDGSSYPNNVEINLNDPSIKQYLNNCASDRERNFYLTHPWFIFFAIRNRNLAVSATSAYFGSNDDNCNGNAFQHAYWSGLNTLIWDHFTAYSMGDLHETAQDSQIQKDMDRHNNDLGVLIAQNIKDQISDPKDQISYLKDYILNSLQVEREGLRINKNVLIPTDWSGNSCE